MSEKRPRGRVLRWRAVNVAHRPPRVMLESVNGLDVYELRFDTFKDARELVKSLTAGGVLDRARRRA